MRAEQAASDGNAGAYAFAGIPWFHFTRSKHEKGIIPFSCSFTVSRPHPTTQHAAQSIWKVFPSLPLILLAPLKARGRFAFPLRDHLLLPPRWGACSITSWGVGPPLISMRSVCTQYSLYVGDLKLGGRRSSAGRLPHAHADTHRTHTRVKYRKKTFCGSRVVTCDNMLIAQDKRHGGQRVCRYIRRQEVPTPLPACRLSALLSETQQGGTVAVGLRMQPRSTDRACAHLHSTNGRPHTTSVATPGIVTRVSRERESAD